MTNTGGGPGYSVPMKATLLALALCGTGCTPYSINPLMDYGSSPAHQTRQPIQTFVQVAYAEDLDTWIDTMTGQQIVIANADAIV
jgi:hypothetical protein